MTISPVAWRDLHAQDDLANVKAPAYASRFDTWRVHFRDMVIHCHDLLSFYYSARDIFLTGLYDFDDPGEGSRIVDGGAHVGLFSLFAARRAPGARILAFEPNPLSLAYLHRNLEANGLTDRVQAQPFGLAARQGLDDFCAGESDDSSLCHGQPTTRIQTLRLSSVLDGPTAVLKLNIEGAECAVMEEAEPALGVVDRIFMEYHGFPELPQTLHRILAVLDRQGFRYCLGAMDPDTNPACHPPFRLGDRRFFNIVHAERQPARRPVALAPPPAVGRVDLGDLRRETPVSRVFGFDRGQCIDRLYIEQFLERHAQAVQGRVLEVGDDAYTRRFGQDRVTRSDVLHIRPGEPGATLHADLGDPHCPLPDNAFDCIVLTQTLIVIPDVHQALRTLHRILKPGGVLLATFPGLAQISRYDMDRWGDYWRFTDRSASMLFGQVFGPERVQVETRGNVLAAIAYLHGLCTADLRPEELERHDPDYQVVITVHATKERPCR